MYHPKNLINDTDQCTQKCEIVGGKMKYLYSFQFAQDESGYQSKNRMVILHLPSVLAFYMLEAKGKKGRGRGEWEGDIVCNHLWRYFVLLVGLGQLRKVAGLYI